MCEYLTTPEGYNWSVENPSEQVTRCINSLVSKGKGGKIGGKGKGKPSFWGDPKGKGKSLKGKGKPKGDGTGKRPLECWACGQVGHPWFLCPNNQNYQPPKGSAKGSSIHQLDLHDRRSNYRQ